MVGYLIPRYKPVLVPDVPIKEVGLQGFPDDVMVAFGNFVVQKEGDGTPIVHS